MKRRDFFTNSLSAAALFYLPVVNVLPKSNLKIGILDTVFKAAGYDAVDDLGSISKYTSSKQALMDLADGIIEVLIASPVMVSNMKSKLPSEFKSQHVGQLSGLKIRVSNLSYEELSSWKARNKPISVTATGSDAVAFERLGFKVRNEAEMLKLSMQLVDLSGNFLNVTNAYPPALFLNIYRSNQKIVAYPCKAPLKNLVIVDRSTCLNSQINLVYRDSLESNLELKKLHKDLIVYLSQDEDYQKQVLNKLLKLPNFTLADGLPSEIQQTIAACKELYYEAVRETGIEDFIQVANYLDRLRVKS